MNILKRNKDVIRERDEKGTTFMEMGRRYGVNYTVLSTMYYNFQPLVDKPWYDTLTEIEPDDQVAVKLARALARYEETYGVKLTDDAIADMDVVSFRGMWGVGASLESALRCVQLHIRAKRRRA